jgi:formylglycine-generating enzyme required for sulfatase activity
MKIQNTLALAVSAALITSASATVTTIDWISIGNINNAADPLTGYGAVDHAYQIGKYEVTNAQYVDFLNAKGASNSSVIFNATMGAEGIYGGSNIVQSGSIGSFSYSVDSIYANMPVVGVTWFNAARFCNWLNNGQGSADMETGAYTLAGAMNGVILANSGAAVRLPSEDEWYKAAYYSANTSTYSLYPNGQNTITSLDANYYPDATGLVDVNYGTASSSGTFGQGGNAWEWNDTVIYGSLRGLRGGSWYPDGSDLSSSNQASSGPSLSGGGVGFRVASVPEPTSILISIVAGCAMLIRRKR